MVVAIVSKVNKVSKVIVMAMLLTTILFAIMVDINWHHEKRLYERFVIGSDKEGYCALSWQDKMAIERNSYQGIEDC